MDRAKTLYRNPGFDSASADGLRNQGCGARKTTVALNDILEPRLAFTWSLPSQQVMDDACR